MRFTLLFTLISHVWTTCSGQIDPGARATSLGGAYAAASDDVWVMSFNMGGLSQVKENIVSFSYSPEPFGLSELSVGAVALAAPTAAGVLGFSATRFGFALYREVSARWAYANTIADAGIGLGIEYRTISIARYGSAGSICIDAGLLVAVSRHIRWGLFIQNLNSAVLGLSHQRLPQVFGMGLAYEPEQELSLLLDYQKEIPYGPSPRFGVEYRVLPAVAFRLGFSDTPRRTSGGIGVQHFGLRIDYTIVSHSELGWSHQASLSIRWGGRHD